MQMTKTGTKRRRATRRELPYGQISLWSCKTSEYRFGRPIREPLPFSQDDLLIEDNYDHWGVRSQQVEKCYREHTVPQTPQTFESGTFLDWWFFGII